MISILGLAKFVLYFYFFLYALVHILVAAYPYIVSYLIFQNTIKWPFGNLSDPSYYGLDNVYNFYLTPETDIKLGVWHFLPKTFAYEHTKHSSRALNQHLKSYLTESDQTPVFIYVHGNDRDRAVPFRLELCNNLVDLGYHVFAIDYRGYGDSTGYPNEEGIVNDILALYKAIISHKPNARIYLYGHSLGTGIVCHTAKKISNSNNKLDGVVLEAPFLNASKASKDYHVALLLNNNNWIRNKIDENLEKFNIRFSSDKNILEINSKILIMHGEDDTFIPIEHGEKLYQIAKEANKNVKFLKLNREFGLGHFLQSHKPIYEHIRNLVNS